jgi:hypothetical protein
LAVGVCRYNAAFSNPLFRIKINNIQLKETAEENAKTNAEVRHTARGTRMARWYQPPGPCREGG